MWFARKQSYVGKGNEKISDSGISTDPKREEGKGFVPKRRNWWGGSWEREGKEKEYKQPQF